MATIATFKTARDGFLEGQIRTLGLNASLTMEPVNSDKEGAPAYRVFADGIELGAAWAKTAKASGRVYHQVRLDDPGLPAPIFASLFRDEDTGGYDLVWNRPKRPARRSATRRSPSRH